jgi:hypothetical protein
MTPMLGSSSPLGRLLSSSSASSSISANLSAIFLFLGFFEGKKKLRCLTVNLLLQVINFRVNLNLILVNGWWEF